jgi:glucosamine--fructose-6-phosphate aminotransferase (isomerizing)
MCGIFAYLNYNVSRERRYILEVLFNGLRRLEYRGYDSSGIALDAGGGQLPYPASPYAGAPPLVFRQEGKIENLVRSVYSGQSSSVSNLKLGYFSGLFFVLFHFVSFRGLTCLFLLYRKKLRF